MPFKNTPTNTCEQCGKSFYRPPSTAKIRRFCSWSCFQASRCGDYVSRFWSKVDRSGGPDACWPWMAYRTPMGYGRFKLNGVMEPAPRVAWEIANNESLGDRFACHHCDNPPCCNPSHIYAGTVVDNNRDRSERGDPKSRYGRAKLSQAIADEIRDLYARGGITQTELARKYGVSLSTVWRIINGRRWHRN